MKIDLPADIRIEQAPEGETLNEMLAAGEIDGFIGPRWPRCYDEGHPHVDRLFPDTVATAEDYFRRRKIFPIMHVLGVRRQLADAHPWLPGALLKAFSQSKQIAQAALGVSPRRVAVEELFHPATVEAYSL